MSMLNPLIIRLQQVLILIGVSRSTVYGKLNERGKQYDPTFPKPIRLGAASVGWRLSDIEAWVETQATKSNGHTQ